MGIEEDRRGGSRRRIEEDCVSSVLGPTGTPQGAKRVRGVLISEGGGGGMYALCLMLHASAPIWLNSFKPLPNGRYHMAHARQLSVKQDN